MESSKIKFVQVIFKLCILAWNTLYFSCAYRYLKAERGIPVFLNLVIKLFKPKAYNSR